MDEIYLSHLFSLSFKYMGSFILFPSAYRYLEGSGIFETQVYR